MHLTTTIESAVTPDRCVTATGAKQRLTICQLLHSLDVGGAEMLAARIARRLKNRFRFVFACLDSVGSLGQLLQKEGFQVEQLGRKPGLDWSCRRRLAKLFDEHGIDVVHAHQYTPFFYGLAARLGRRWRPILFTEHGRHQPDYRRLKRVVWNRLMLSRRDRVVGVGAAVRQALIENEGLPPDRVEVLHNGIGVDEFAKPGDRTSARQVFGAAVEDFVIIQVARLDYLKDHQTAVRSFAHVVSQRPNARFVLVGDGPERETIEAEARASGVHERMTFLGIRHDVPGLLAGADVFLLTSVSEGIPLTVLEAMAAGLPVVGTDVGGMSEVVVTDETGLLVPAKDVVAVATAVLKIAADRELARRFGEAGQRRVRQHFDEAQMCASYGRIYEELVAA